MTDFQKELSRIKQGNLENIYLILGTEPYLIDWVKQELKVAVLGNDQESEFNFSTYNLKETPIDNALFEAQSYPFFGDQRLLFLNDAYFFTGSDAPKSQPNHDLTLLIDYLEKPSDFSTLVFFVPYEKLDKRKKITKILNKNTQIIDVNPLADNQVAQFVKNEADTRGYTFTAQAFNLLLERTDYKLTSTMSELEKLFLFHLEDRKIVKETVVDLVTKSLEHNVFQINESVLKQNSREAIAVFNDLLLQKEEPIKIIAIMMGQFRLLLQVKFLRSKGYQQKDIAEILKVHPYRVKLAINQERKFHENTLKNAHRAIINLDYEIKSGQIEASKGFELFVLKFSAQSVH